MWEVDLAEALRVEPRQELAQADLEEEPPGRTVDLSVVPGGLDPADRFHGDGDDARAAAREQSPQGRRGEGQASALHRVGRGGDVHVGADALEHPPEALCAEGLEEVVKGPQLERGHRETVVGGGEHEGRAVPDVLDGLQAGQLRQADVQEQEVRLEIVHQAHRRRAVARLARELDPLHSFQVGAEGTLGLRLVLRDRGAHHAAAHAGSGASRSRGRSMVACRPPPSAGCRERVAFPA